MKVKVKFKAIKYHGGQCTFVKIIDVPDDLTTVEEQDDYINDFDKSGIMVDHDLHGIIDFWRYVKKQRGEKKPSWKDVSKKWEHATEIAMENTQTYKNLYESAKESSAIWEQNAKDWKKIAIEYRGYIEKLMRGEKLQPLFDTESVVKEASVKFSSLDTNEPVDITKNYSGGWLAPNGDFYGMDGSYEDMIHQQLADKLLELGLIPEEKHGFHNPDSWLCDNGWVKIHSDHILYDGYLRGKPNSLFPELPTKPVIPMTDEQREQIYKYGALCCYSKLFFGLQKQFASAAKFKMMEAPMIWKLFDF